ncbi:MAG: fused signal recognition particle receptor [Actinomycetota bacterium]|jgi:fused signal recognition particle receptor|nr:fused signal recognition particle receptor [Actinomycetota bacterium]
MPEGILPELIIVAALLVLVAGIGIASRSKRAPKGDRPATRPDATKPTPQAPVASEETLAVEETAAAPVEVAAPEEPAKPQLGLRERLGKSRRFLADKLATALGGSDTDETWDDLEAALIQADIGVATATRLTEAVRDSSRKADGNDPQALKSLLAGELHGLFDESAERALHFSNEKPTVWMVVGVNGTGKTTTIGKLAQDATNRGRTVALAAADTFRAAADEQLGVWAERSGAELVKHQHGADPGAVAYDALQHARAKELDILIVDTAGRLHTKTPLMDELGKVKRVIEKEGTVHEVLLVIDATAGQNGLIQAKEFAAASGVTGIVLTKLDGTAKGGIAVAIENELGIPIKLIGVGEGIDDLEPFEPKAFVDALLS